MLLLIGNRIEPLQHGRFRRFSDLGFRYAFGKPLRRSLVVYVQHCVQLCQPCGFSLQLIPLWKGLAQLCFCSFQLCLDIVQPFLYPSQTFRHGIERIFHADKIATGILAQ